MSRSFWRREREGKIIFIKGNNWIDSKQDGREEAGIDTITFTTGERLQQPQRGSSSSSVGASGWQTLEVFWRQHVIASDKAKKQRRRQKTKGQIFLSDPFCKDASNNELELFLF